MFDGRSSRRHVNLGGRNAKTETREQVLARTRAEREARARHKLERQSAICIQAYWRAKHALGVSREAHRAAWQRAFGASGQDVTAGDAIAGSRYLRSLLFFIRPPNLNDVLLLTQAARLIVSEQQQQGHPLLGFNGNNGSTVMYTAQRLLHISLEILVIHRESFAAELAQPRHAISASSSPAGLLIELLLTLTGASCTAERGPETLHPQDAGAWGKAGAGPSAGTVAAAAELLQWASTRAGLHGSLAQILQAAKLPDRVALPPGQPVSAAEALATTLSARALKAAAGGDTTVRGNLTALMAVPLLWQRAPTMRAIQADVVRHTAAALATLSPAEAAASVARAVGATTPADRMLATASVLGNLLDAASGVLRDPKVGGARLLQLLAALSALVAALPLSALLRGQSQDDDPLSEGMRRSRHPEELAKPAGFVLAAGIMRQLEGLASLQLLRSLVHALLPAADVAASEALPPLPPPDHRTPASPYSGGAVFGSSVRESASPGMSDGGDACFGSGTAIAPGAAFGGGAPAFGSGRGAFGSAPALGAGTVSGSGVGASPASTSVSLSPSSGGGAAFGSGAAAFGSGSISQRSPAFGSGAGRAGTGAMGFVGTVNVAQTSTDVVPMQIDSVSPPGSGVGALNVDGAFGSPARSSSHSAAVSLAIGSLRGGLTPPGPLGVLSPSSPQTSAAAEAASAVPSNPVAGLLHLLGQVVDVPSLRQPALTRLAVHIGLAQRLWFSHLRPMQVQARQALPRNIWQWGPALVLLSRVQSVYLLTAGDAELAGRGAPLPPGELHDPARPAAGLLPMLCAALWQTLWVDTGGPSGSSGSKQAGLQELREDVRNACSNVTRQLFDRNSQRPFAAASAFVAEGLDSERFLAEMRVSASAPSGLLDLANSRVAGVLRQAPFLVAFEERAQVFHTMVAAEKARGAQWMDRGSFATIRRDSLVDDGFHSLGQLQPEQLRQKIRIQFVDQHGIPEAGIDGGGLFKDFMENLVKEGFDPNAGLFAATSDNKLYPNPAAGALVGDAPRLLDFLGRMLGKALFEGILLELPLAGFFLKQLLPGAWCDVNDLPTLDAELYRNLMHLRDYQGDAADLALTFTISKSAVEDREEVDLIYNGSNVPVTNENKMSYIYKVADYRLNRQLSGLTAAFRAGLSSVVPPAWLGMFAPGELQTLISGAGGGVVDLADLAAHTQYAGGYHAEHPVITNFWKAMESFSAEDQRNFLRFVTSVSRGPLLGFKYLEPPLCIQMAGGVLSRGSQRRLPTAATCMNLLKLPPYPKLKEMKEKLLYSITSSSGFDLS